MSGVWNAPPTFSARRAAHADLLRARDRQLDAFGRARDHDLAGRVVVRDPARVGCRRARFLGLLDRRAEQRGHAAGMRVGRGLRELGAPRREAHAVFEIERARRDRARSPVRASGPRTRRSSCEQRPRRFPRDERRAQHRELRVARARELLGGRVEQRAAASGSPSAASACSTIFHAGWSCQGAPMPGVCVP